MNRQEAYQAFVALEQALDAKVRAELEYEKARDVVQRILHEAFPLPRTS